MSRNGIVTTKMDLANPQPVSAAQDAELKALATLTDDEIDVSEIPPLTETFWQNAVRNPLYKPMKTQLTVRLDADVLTWLRSTGSGYQTKLNAILRQAMLHDVAK